MLKTVWDCMNPALQQMNEFLQIHILLAVIFIRKWSKNKDRKKCVILWVLHLFDWLWTSCSLKLIYNTHPTKLNDYYYISWNQQRHNHILVKTLAERPYCLLCCRCLCIAPSTGCLWLFVMDCKPWCRHTVQPREPHPIPSGDAPALHADRTLRSASLSCLALPSPPSPNSSTLRLPNAGMTLQPKQQRHCNTPCIT